VTADQVWQIITTVGSVAVLVGGASWKLANVLDSVKVSVIALKAEVQQDVAAVRSDVTLLRTSIDGKLALVEAQTKADIVALKAALERMDDELEKLKQPATPPRSRRGAA
jgi:hypothetical protein